MDENGFHEATMDEHDVDWSSIFLDYNGVHSRFGPKPPPFSAPGLVLG